MIGKYLEFAHQFPGLRRPASADTLQHLHSFLGPLPDAIERLYRDHDGSDHLQSDGKQWLPCRLLPIDQAIRDSSLINNTCGPTGELGSIAWLWYDEQSNYAGVYKSGPLRGWITILNHEEQLLIPAFRSIGSFLQHVTLSDNRNGDLTTLARELPLVQADDALVSTDRELSRGFQILWANEHDVDLRSLYAAVSMAVTPPADTSDVVRFFGEPDMWTPELAVRLLEFRNVLGHVHELERLSREGSHNGCSAAIRRLTRMNTGEADAAVERLRSSLTDQRLAVLNQWLGFKARTLPKVVWP